MKRHLRKAVHAALEGLPKKVLTDLLVNEAQYSISLSLISAKAMRNLNLEYRGKDKPTDVLSFSRLEGEQHPTPFPEAGDILICWDVIKAQAKEYKVPLNQELQRMAVHGVLHLFGYDHERDAKEARRMFRLQNKILATLE